MAVVGGRERQHCADSRRGLWRRRVDYGHRFISLQIDGTEAGLTSEEARFLANPLVRNAGQLEHEPFRSKSDELKMSAVEYAEARGLPTSGTTG